jgi:DNA-binding LytR/AlgR family response regulator
MGVSISDNPTHIFMEVAYEQDFFKVKNDDGDIMFINLDDIYLIESFGNSVELKTYKNIYKIKEKLYEIENMYLRNKLVRINKSQIVSLSKIAKLSPLINSKLKLKMLNNDIVYVTRSYKRDFLNKLNIGGNI